MPVAANNVIRFSYTGSGTTGPFTTPYFLTNADIKAVKVLIADGTETLLVLTTDYTLTGAGDDVGGTLTLVAALTSSYRLVIINDAVNSQTADYPANDAFPSATHQDVVDRRTMVAQRHDDRLDRTLRQPDGDAASIAELPSKVDRASKLLAFDADGDPLSSAGTGGAATSTFMATVLDDADARTARTTLGVHRMFDLTVAPSTSYTVATTDEGKSFANNSAAPQAYALPQTSAGIAGLWVRFVNTIGSAGINTITPFSGEKIRIGGSALDSLTLKNLNSFVILSNTGGTGGNGWHAVAASPDVYANLPEGFRPVHGNVRLSAPIGAEDPNVISLSPIQAGGLLVKDSTGLWGFVDFVSQNSIEGDRTNCYVDGVAAQTLASNTFYFVGVKIVGGTPVINFTTYSPRTKTADTFVDVFGIDDETSIVGMVYTLGDSFLFDPLAGRSVMSNFFPVCNQFGIEAQGTVGSITSTSYVDLGTTFDVHAVMNAEKTIHVIASGYGSVDADGGSFFIQLRAFDSAGNQIGTGSESAGTSPAVNGPQSLVSCYSQPLPDGYARFEVWGKVGGGGITGSFTLRNLCLLLSA